MNCFRRLFFSFCLFALDPSTSLWARLPADCQILIVEALALHSITRCRHCFEEIWYTRWCDWIHTHTCFRCSGKFGLRKTLLLRAGKRLK